MMLYHVEARNVSSKIKKRGGWARYSWPRASSRIMELFLFLVCSVCAIEFNGVRLRPLQLFRGKDSTEEINRKG
jgi:hypothetical protein